jgi:hypothetical protein
MWTSTAHQGRQPGRKPCWWRTVERGSTQRTLRSQFDPHAENVDGLLEETGWYTSSILILRFPRPFSEWMLARSAATRARCWGRLFRVGLGYDAAAGSATRVMTMMPTCRARAFVPGRYTMKAYMAEIAAREP